jgi:hypothetical protein
MLLTVTSHGDETPMANTLATVKATRRRLATEQAEFPRVALLFDSMEYAGRSRHDRG